MSDELKKKVARLFCDTAAGQCGDDFFCEQCLGGADEVTAICMEEAARVVALMPRTYDKIKQDHDVLGMKGTWTFTLNNGPAECAAAIRALKDRT
jgi:hypothetical protein